MESIQPQTEISTRNISWEVKAAGASDLHYHFRVSIVMKSRSLNLLEPSGPVQACVGIALLLLVNMPNELRNVKTTRLRALEI